jgi:hypothetical protein
MWKKLRIALLLFVLVSVAHTAWYAGKRTSEWKYSVRVAVYPIMADDSKVTQDYVRGVTGSSYSPIGEFMKAEGARHGLALDTPVEMHLAHAVDSSPPAPPFGGGTLDIMLWSLKFRYWAWRVDKFKRPKPDVRLFVRYHDPKRTQRLPHSTGLQKGQLGIVNAFADAAQEGSNNVVIAHELLHTLGAGDKYDLANGLPLHPHGYANPQAQPLHPQRQCEIMAGRIPVAASQADIPQSLAQCVIGPATAQEIHWLRQK